MTRPEYVVTREGGPSANGLLDFGPVQGKLHKLEVDKNCHIFYVQIATGKLADLTKLAELLNSALEPMAETAKVEEEPKVSVGIPTVVESVQQSPYQRPGWEPLWLLGELERTLELSNGGKINLPQFRHHIESIVRQMKEDIPK